MKTGLPSHSRKCTFADIRHVSLYDTVLTSNLTKRVAVEVTLSLLYCPNEI